MFHKLNEINRLADSMTVAEFQLVMNKWDDELTDYMRSAESKCNKFHMGHIDYSPEANAWLRRRWLLGRVARYLDGKVPDPQNLFRDCDKHGVGDPRQMTREVLNAELIICHAKIEDLKLKAPEMRRKHLKGRLKLAQERGDEEAAAAILKILHKEASRKRWR